MRGIEPRAFHMQSERSTTELHPLAYPSLLFVLYSSQRRQFRLEREGYIEICCRLTVWKIIKIMKNFEIGFSKYDFV